MLGETKSYLRIDGSEEDFFLTSLIMAAELYIKNATGKTIDVNNELHKLAVNMLVTHWYENREPIGKAELLAFGMESIFLQMKYCLGDTV